MTTVTAQERKISVGDVVQLKSGGPTMTVVDVYGRHYGVRRAASSGRIRL
jgi:uncharacterized protein YodC (DUF2158 family)